MKKAIITGIKGQDGAYLSKLLLTKGYEVSGIDLPNSSNNNLKYLNIEKLINIVDADILDLSNIIKILEKYEPDEIYNLASQSSVGLSYDQPVRTLELNIISVANILEAIKLVNPYAKLYQASSSEMFGNVDVNLLPVKEDYVFHPVSPYAISKASAHWITVNYREAYGLFTSCGILFNHESVLRGDNFVTKKILNTAVKIKMGLADELVLGNTNIYRDWGYAPNYVEAMWMMLQQDKPDDYIICSGEAHSLQEFIEKTFLALNLKFEKYVRIDSNLYRPIDMNIIYGDNSKAETKLKWSYKHSFDELIKKLVEDEIVLVKSILDK